MILDSRIVQSCFDTAEILERSVQSISANSGPDRNRYRIGTVTATEFDSRFPKKLHVASSGAHVEVVAGNVIVIG